MWRAMRSSRRAAVWAPPWNEAGSSTIAIRHQAAEAARGADGAIHHQPYHGIAIGVGVGALLGYLLAGRCRPGGD